MSAYAIVKEEHCRGMEKKCLADFFDIQKFFLGDQKTGK